METDKQERKTKQEKEEASVNTVRYLVKSKVQ